MSVIAVTLSLGVVLLVGFCAGWLWSVSRKRRPLRQSTGTAHAYPDSEQPDFRRIVENISEAYFFYRHDTEGCFTYLSPSVKRVLGYEPGEYRAHFSEMLTDSPVNTGATDRTTAALRGERQPTYDVEVRARDGTIHRLQVTEYPIYTASGEVEGVEGIAHDVSERVRLEQRLRELAVRDDLTGLFNRRHLLERMEHEVAASERYGHPLSYVMLDLDGLKQVNDTYGHAAGDLLIRSAATILQAELRRCDIVARRKSIPGRIGGDEFAAILPFTTEEQAVIALQRVLASFTGHATDLPDASGKITLSASVGIAGFSHSMAGAEVERRADRALYRAKQTGRNRICVWDDSIG